MHRISMLGVPYDGGSTYARGAALGPPKIREALASDSSNLWTEDGVDLGASDILHDLGDLEVPSDDRNAVFEVIRQAAAHAVRSGGPIICLGGDHSITYPILRGLSTQNLTILHFDAHPDLYQDYGGRLSHACQFARIMEERLARRLIQVGIRTMNGEQREQARRFGVEVVSMRQLDTLARVAIEGPVYISFDLDALDPAFAPAVSHLEPGGLSVREVLTLIQSVRAPVVGADIVELNPQRDGARRTAMVAAKVLKEIAAAMLRDGAEPQPGWV